MGGLKALSDVRKAGRKASAHGLGHLLPPYNDDKAPTDIPPPSSSLHEIGVDRWEYDLWYQIVVAALDGHPDQVDLDPLPGLDHPAVSRYAATTPRLLAWFEAHNATRPEEERVRPFNFLLAFQADPLAVMAERNQRLLMANSSSRPSQGPEQTWKVLRRAILAEGGVRPEPGDRGAVLPHSVCRAEGLAVADMARRLGYSDAAEFTDVVQRTKREAVRNQQMRRATTGLPRAVAPFDASGEMAASKCFDRVTGRPVDSKLLKTYRQALAQYHLHPEAKFRGGGYLDRGIVQRRHIQASRVEYIGKEANRWEEQAHLGLDVGAQIVYGASPEAQRESVEELRLMTRRHSVRRLAREAGIDPRTVTRFRAGRVTPHDGTVSRLRRAVGRLERPVEASVHR